MTRRRREITMRGPPFVEIEGVLYRNMAFDLWPLGEDVRERIAAELGIRPDSLHVLQRLARREARLLRCARDSADVEAWAVLRSSRQGR